MNSKTCVDLLFRADVTEVCFLIEYLFAVSAGFKLFIDTSLSLAVSLSLCKRCFSFLEQMRFRD